MSKKKADQQASHENMHVHDTSGSAQRIRLLAHLRQHGSINTFQAITLLNILRPGARIEGRTLSVIDCDYLPELEPRPFPPELALLIVRKAAAMAEAFESKALDQMTRDASRALRNGMEPRRIIRQMGL